MCWVHPLASSDMLRWQSCTFCCRLLLPVICFSRLIHALRCCVKVCGG